MSEGPRPTDPTRRSSGFRDLLVILAAVAVLFVLAGALHVFDRFAEKLAADGHLDELWGVSVLLLGGIAIFALRRSHQAEHERLLRRETEERFRTIVERVPAVAYVWDGADAPGQASAAYISPQIEPLLGFTGEQWVADPEQWNKRVHPADHDRVLRAWEAAVEAGDPFAEEYRIRRADGRWVWLRDEANPVGSGARAHPVYEGVLFDVTERREAEERYRALVEQIPAITYIEDPSDGHNLYISPQIEELYGFTLEEWRADPGMWASRLHPDDRERVLAENAADTGDTWSSDYRSIRRDGSVVWLHNEAVLLRDEDGQPLYWQGIVIDITARKEAEQRLRDAEERYRLLVEQLPVAVYTDAVDDVSTALYISPQYERLTGYSPEQRLHDPELWVRMLHPDDRERVLEESARTNTTRDPFDVEYRIVASDGRIAWLHDHAIFVERPDGEHIWQGVLTDVTERRLAQQALAGRDRILQATAFAAEQFLTSADWTDTLDDVLRRLGEAGGASRAHVYANETGFDGEPSVTLLHGWYAPGWELPDDRALSIRFPWVAGGFERWKALLSSRRVVHGAVHDFPESERVVLQAVPTAVAAVVAVPIFVEDEWWGYVGFDRCDTASLWQEAEIEALAVTANTLGAAIGRQRAAERLAEAQERYRMLVEKMPAITYVDEYRPDLRGVWPTSYISPQVETLLGYSPERWMNDPTLWPGIIHPDDAERAREADQRHYATGEPLDIEIRVRTGDGSYRWLRDRAVIIRDDEGRPRWSQGILLDVTERRVAETALDEAERRYRTLIETIPAVTYVDAVDDVSTTIYVSPQIETTTGYTQEEWTSGRAVWTDNCHPDDLPRVMEAEQRHNLNGEAYEVEYRFRHRDGHWVWIRDQALVIRDEAGSLLFSQGVMYDVTAQKAAEEQLRDAEERFRAIVEHVPAAIYLDRADDSMETVYVSPQIEEMTGIPPQEWIDEPRAWLDAVEPVDREAVMADYLASIESCTPWTAEYRLRTRDGRTIWVHDETTFLYDDEGNASFVQGVLFDVTERRVAEEALRDSEQRERDAAERLRALDDMKNTFLAAVSHELRSPLTSILGLALTLERTPDIEGPDRDDLLNRLAANARKLDRLLKDLLDIDRLNRGIVEPQYRVTDVGALARRTVESLDALAGRDVVTETDAVVLAVDPAKVERIVENLLMNAARHTPADRRVWLRVQPSAGGVLIVVDDDGYGVPEELRSAIFEPFLQGPTSSPHSPGTGIGLSLVASFAELHGGRAWVEEREGGGASFRVFIPGTVGSTMARPDGFDDATTIPRPESRARVETG